MKNQTGELLISAVVIACLGLLFVPIPAPLLDLFMIGNLTISLVVILVSVSLRRGTEFTVFPTLLLFLTIFRLSLNVSSTRLILSKGTEFDGIVVRAFGQFMAGDSALIGGVVFFILVVIQYFVITKGAERIAEVAARFSLDSTAVRIMAIESEQTAGLISQEEAVAKRESIKRESGFHSSMEGASRFIKGENLASIVILFINLFGGLITTWHRDLGGGLVEIISSIGLLTIGDGLVNLISSLLVSTAAGILVTRVDSGERISEQLVSQVGQDPRTLAIACGFLGLTLAAFGWGSSQTSYMAVLIGIGLMVLSYPILTRQEEPSVETGPQGPETPSKTIDDVLVVRPLEIGISAELKARLDAEELTGTNLLEMVAENAARRMGILVPEGPFITDDRLEPRAFALFIRGTHLAAGFLDSIDSPVKDRLVSGLTDLVLAHAEEIMSLEETRRLIDKNAARYPVAAAEIQSGKVPLLVVHRTLCALLCEGIPIRNLPSIMPVIAANAEFRRMDPLQLAEDVRVSLSRQISTELADPDRVIRTLILGTEIELTLSQALEEGKGSRLALDTRFARTLVDTLAKLCSKVTEKGMRPVLTVQESLRPHLARLLRKSVPCLSVLAFPEVGRDFKLSQIGVVRLPS